MNSDPDASMDTQLLQLERELFSLSPVETPRHLASRIDRQVLGPVGIVRHTEGPPTIVPFPWRRMAVPAAAAVVVVSVLHHLDRPIGKSVGLAGSNSASPAAATESRRSSVTLTNDYVLRTEPVLIRPGTWQATEQLYFIRPSPGSSFGSGYNAPQRASGFTPVIFH